MDYDQPNEPDSELIRACLPWLIAFALLAAFTVAVVPWGER